MGRRLGKRRLAEGNQRGLKKRVLSQMGFERRKENGLREAGEGHGGPGHSSVVSLMLT